MSDPIHLLNERLQLLHKALDDLIAKRIPGDGDGDGIPYESKRKKPGIGAAPARPGISREETNAAARARTHNTKEGIARHAGLVKLVGSPKFSMRAKDLMTELDDARALMQGGAAHPAHQQLKDARTFVQSKALLSPTKIFSDAERRTISDLLTGAKRYQDGDIVTANRSAS